MKCLINKTIDRYLAVGATTDAIIKYIKDKYKITIDRSSILERIRLKKLNY